ncbi:PAX3- and PAX7-binding protein 1 [Aplysia californica]|uniref:PAX3- and PAX7-binding protein 1 n=1 Tax=Aplysia californica TaxID=6500 RepID=A0ABM0K9N5_APLCA|nr:PAX3- and PAX7-binding protein 1 [Aplysia californica]
MASMFKKPKRNFRRKGLNLDSDNENEAVQAMDTQELPPMLPKTENDKGKDEKKSKGSSRNKTVVSFELEGEDEEETEVFKVKKSSHSRRIAKQMKKERRDKGKDPLNNGNGNGKEKEGASDSDDGEAQGKRDHAYRKQRKNEEDEARAEDKLRKLREEFRTLNGEDAEEAEDSDDGDGQKTFKAMLARGEIPDAKTIHFIRKQRQMARETDNFIPINEPEEKSSKSSTARLVRDDDNDKSEDEEDQRVDFSVNNAARERQQLRDNFLAAEQGSDEDSDQEREWENQQIRKAVSLQIPGVELLPSTTVSDNNSNVSFYSSTQTTAAAGAELPASSSDELKPFSALSKFQNASEITIESVRKRLQERLSIMDTVYRTHKLELERTLSDSADTRDSIENCQQSAPQLEDRFQFFQELRGYVRDLIECLNEKVPLLTDLEQRVENLLKSRASRLIQRRQQDVQDQCRDYMTNASSVKMDVEAGEELARQRRAAEREARRSRRRRAREGKNMVGHHDGLSSDDEESSQSLALKFNSEMEEIVRSRDTMFDDVVDEFSLIEHVKKQFEDWKFTYGDTYREAYIGLCMPKLLNPFVRKELLAWNPFAENCVDFEDMSWFTILLFMGSKEGDEMDRGDDDVRILPSIVEKIILPKMTFLVQNVWDPISTAQSTRLVSLTLKLTNQYPTIHAKNKNFRVYLEAVVARLSKTLDDDVFMPMYPLSVLDNRSSGPAVFFHRQSWTCIKLLGNILSWHQLISAPTLQRLALSGLLNRYIVVGLVSSHINREALHKCQAIISTFPKEWFSNLEGDSTVPQLENLCRYLVSAAKTLHKATALEKDCDRLEGRELVKQMSKHLVNIHAMDHAMSLATEFSFKIGQV